MAVADTDRYTAARDPAANLDAARVDLGGGVQIGPLGHIADERQRLAALEWEHFEAAPLAATIGAELSGVDITAELPDEVIAEIRQALYDYKVVFFRDQPLTPEQHLGFARRFGELEHHPFIPGNRQHPELVRFEKSADVGGYENGWHHDVTWREVPSMGAILHAIQVPPTGGDTLFSDSYAAYEGLDDEVKTRIESMTATHDYMKAFRQQVPPDKEAEMRAKFPPVHHPVVCTHPATGRRHLYVNRFFVAHLDDIDPEEGEALLHHLCDRSAILEYQCRFRWEPDSVAFWDNRAVQHYAASDYWPDVRVMERASIVGSRPTP